jgi:hypothetical protein
LKHHNWRISVHIFLSIGRSTCSVQVSSWASLVLGLWAGRKWSSSTTSSKEPPVAKVVYKSSYKVSKPYGFFNFLVDAVLTVATGGLWLIWIFVREMRK